MKLDGFLNNNLYFKAGLTKKIIEMEQSINIERQEKIFNENYGVETCFLNNKSAVCANRLCLNIFEQLSSKLKLKLTIPPAIYLYNKNQIMDKTSPANFCISDTKEVLQNEYPFPGRTIFFRNFKNLEEVNANSEMLFNTRISSSSHFLAPFIHEWIHSFHLDYIYKRFGYGGNCEYLKEVYPLKQINFKGVELLKILETKTLSKIENKQIFEHLGKYSTFPINQYLEIFSETMTQFICKSLKDCEIKQNPLEHLKKTSPQFQQIFKKVCLFK